MTAQSAPKAFDKAAWLARYLAEQKRRQKYSPAVRKILNAADRKRDWGRIDRLIAGFADLRRDEERFGVRLDESTYRSYRRLQALTGRAMPLDVLLQKHRLVTADLVLPGDEAAVAEWREHVTRLGTQHGIEITYPVIGQQNGYAFTGSRKRIEAPAITNAAAYACVLHEIGHCAQPCAAPHVRAQSGDGKRTLCVRCELSAWIWAQDHARPHWTREMHRELARSLPTYRKYGRPEEQSEIDALCSHRAYYEARQRRAMRTH